MNILIYGLNYAPEKTGIGKYTGEMGEWLIERGHNVTVVTSQPYYPEWKIHQGYSKYWYTRTKHNGGSLIRCPLYVPKSPTTIKRIIHLLSFALSSAFAIFFKLFKKKADVIFVVQPSLFCAPMALLYAKLKGAKSIMHIQDYEIDAMLGLKMANATPAYNTINKVESRLMRRFDRISSISHSMVNRAIEKGIPESKTVLFPNWSDIESVRPLIDSTKLKLEMGYKTTDKVVLYSGNVGKKQGLEIVIDAALKLRTLHFAIVGTGAHADQLREYAASAGANNVRFFELLPWSRVPELLSMAAVHLVIQKRGVADAVMPSKVTNILAAGGKAIITADCNTELSRIHEDNPGIFTLIQTECAHELADSIRMMLKSKEEGPCGYNHVAREYAIKNFSKPRVLESFETAILYTIQSTKIPITSQSEKANQCKLSKIPLEK